MCFASFAANSDIDLFPIDVLIVTRPAIDLCLTVPAIETAEIRTTPLRCDIGCSAIGAGKYYGDAC